MEELTIDETISQENKEIVDDISDFKPEDIIVFSRHWSIETITSQIKQGNIDLNPKFQRRNAWTDAKRSKLIESILIGYPIPEVVLAEDPNKKKSFIVIDGKQRLLTIAGFVEPTQYKYWDKDQLVELGIRRDLNGLTFQQLSTDPNLSSEYRQFMNSSLGCTIITHFSTNDALYDIFYRLNSGSTPLSTQELRQVLNRGPFADYLIDVTDNLTPIHEVMNLNGPDKRLRDIEVALRLILFTIFPTEYKGNLKRFLDEKMEYVSKDWQKFQPIVQNQFNLINEALNHLASIFGAFNLIGRKMNDVRFEGRFNRVLLEVQVFYHSHLLSLPSIDSSKYMAEFARLSNDPNFRASIESTTKSVESYKTRYGLYENMLNNLLPHPLNVNPYR